MLFEVVPSRIELESRASETLILSIVLRDQNSMACKTRLFFVKGGGFVLLFFPWLQVGKDRVRQKTSLPGDPDHAAIVKGENFKAIDQGGAAY